MKNPETQNLEQLFHAQLMKSPRWARNDASGAQVKEFKFSGTESTGTHNGEVVTITDDL